MSNFIYLFNVINNNYNNSVIETDFNVRKLKNKLIAAWACN